MEQRFAYGPSKRSSITVAVTGLLMIAGGFFLGRGGFVIGRFNSFLSPEASRVLWALIAAGGAALFIVGVLMARAGVGEVVVAPTMISAPRSEYSREIVHIHPATISNMATVANQYGETTTITYPEGKLKLIKGHFGDPAAYLNCVNAIRYVANAASGVRPG